MLFHTFSQEYVQEEEEPAPGSASAASNDAPAEEEEEEKPPARLGEFIESATELADIRDGMKGKPQ